MTADQRPGIYQGSEKLQGLPPGLPIYEIVNIRDALADNHRPLYEIRATIEAIQKAMAHGAFFKEVRSTHPGSRYGTFMNADALQAMRRHGQNIVDGLGWIHDTYVQNPEQSRISISEALVLANITHSLPRLLVSRGKDSYARTAVPAIVADIFKASRGIVDPLRKLLVEDLTTTITGQELYDVAESRGLLVTEDGRGCAELQEKIVAAADALFFGKGAQPERSKVPTYINDAEQLAVFNTLMMDYEGHVMGFKVISHRILEPESKSPLRSYHSYREYARDETGLVDYLNQVQDAMNDVLGRDQTTAPRFTSSDLAKLELTRITPKMAVVSFVGRKPHLYRAVTQ